MTKSKLFRAILAALLMAARSLSAFPLLSSNELVYVNVDHAPVGACSTITYGYKGPTPWYDKTSDWCGLGMSSPHIPYFGGGGGVLIALSGNSGLQALPFVVSAASISSSAAYFADTNVERSLTPCTDQWTLKGTGLTFTHYTPAWSMASLDTATLNDKKRFFLPATWIEFTIANTNSTSEDFYFGLPEPATQQSFANGAYQGFALGEAALAVQTGSCELLSGASLTAALNGMTKGFAFHVGVPAGQTKTLTVVIAYYRSAVVDSRISAFYYYTSLFPSIDSVIDSAFSGFGDAQIRCRQLASAMANAGLNVYRQFLASHAMHSYMADTACLIDPAGGVHWNEMEGDYAYINTFDLTVDHAYYASLMHPWTLRNVLDTFSGALDRTGYSYDLPLYDPSSATVVSSNGFSFHHDMGIWPASDPPGGFSPYEDGYISMGQEELQNWILSAGLYWSHTGDSVWLTNNEALLKICLDSMLSRDSTNAAARDGTTRNINERGGNPEITTFDSLDSSLREPRLNGRITTRNWACYLALQAIFSQIGDEAEAATCQSAASAAAQTLVNRWNTYQGALGYIPALLDGSDLSAIILMVEGLAYPAVMGLTNAVDRTGGPYASMLQALSNHLVAVLVPGKCLDATSGAWMMTSANDNTWQSKNYICQFVAETVLGISNNNVNGTIDQIHATIQIQNAPIQAWSDQTDGSGANVFLGSQHYPRGITSALWWLTPSNNPVFLAPAVGTNIAATINGTELTISWPSNYVGWILQSNAINIANRAGWGDVPGSSTHSQMTFPTIDLAVPKTFYRLRHP